MTDKELQLFKIELNDDDTWALAVWGVSSDYYTGIKEEGFVGVCDFDTYGECLLEMNNIIKYIELDE